MKFQKVSSTRHSHCRFSRSSRTSTHHESTGGSVSYVPLQVSDNSQRVSMVSHVDADFANPESARTLDRECTSESGKPTSRLDRASGLLKNVVIGKRNRPMLEKGSVYGAAVLVPQLARSAGWTWELSLLTMKVYLFLVLNLAIQFMLVASIEKEETVMDLFSGQMYLCDFGAPIDHCPESPSCKGPGGTQIEASRLYPFPTWALRNFVKQSLQTVFPEHKQEIEGKIDPGEYGAESISIRLLCSFIFMMSVMSELELIVNMSRFLYIVPTEAEPWIDIDDCDERYGELCVKVAGMPMVWKILNVSLVLVPKTLLWWLTAEAGITFLMETATIDDMIVNAVALSFILQIDEAICDNLMSDQTQELLDMCVEPSSPDDQKASTTANEETWNICNLATKFIELIPFRLVTCLLLMIFFVYWYYFQHCKWNPDGRWWSSKPMQLPLTTDFTILNIFFPGWFPVPRETKPYWRMPDDNE